MSRMAPSMMRFGKPHARNFGDIAPEILGGPLRPGEDVGKTGSLVVGGGGLFKRFDRRQSHDEQRNAGSDHEGDGQHLGLQPPEFTKKLSIKAAHHAYQESSAGAR
jgi:hypothetical protein